MDDKQQKARAPSQWARFLHFGGAAFLVRSSSDECFLLLFEAITIAAHLTVFNLLERQAKHAVRGSSRICTGASGVGEVLFELIYKIRGAFEELRYLTKCLKFRFITQRTICRTTTTGSGISA